VSGELKDGVGFGASGFICKVNSLSELMYEAKNTCLKDNNPID
jgi:hypothetical protein